LQLINSLLVNNSAENPKLEEKPISIPNVNFKDSRYFEELNNKNSKYHEKIKYKI